MLFINPETKRKKRKFVCDICYLSSEKRHKVVNHMLEHDKNYFQCTKCDFSFGCKKGLALHTRKCIGSISLRRIHRKKVKTEISERQKETNVTINMPQEANPTQSASLIKTERC